jgi:hypothetical protein
MVMVGGLIGGGLWFMREAMATASYPGSNPDYITEIDLESDWDTTTITDYAVVIPAVSPYRNLMPYYIDLTEGITMCTEVSGGGTCLTRITTGLPTTNQWLHDTDYNEATFHSSRANTTVYLSCEAFATIPRAWEFQNVKDDTEAMIKALRDPTVGIAHDLIPDGAGTRKLGADLAEWNAALASATMTGNLTLSGDPTAALHAATKQYHDNNPFTGGVVPNDATFQGAFYTQSNAEAQLGAGETLTIGGTDYMEIDERGMMTSTANLGTGVRYVWNFEDLFGGDANDYALHGGNGGGALDNRLGVNALGQAFFTGGFPALNGISPWGDTSRPWGDLVADQAQFGSIVDHWVYMVPGDATAIRCTDGVDWIDIGFDGVTTTTASHFNDSTAMLHGLSELTGYYQGISPNGEFHTHIVGAVCMSGSAAVAESIELSYWTNGTGDYITSVTLTRWDGDGGTTNVFISNDDLGNGSTGWASASIDILPDHKMTDYPYLIRFAGVYTPAADIRIGRVGVMLSSERP